MCCPIMCSDSDSEIPIDGDDALDHETSTRETNRRTEKVLVDSSEEKSVMSLRNELQKRGLLDTGEMSQKSLLDEQNR
jgi:hypothetical protein